MLDNLTFYASLIHSAAGRERDCLPTEDRVKLEDWHIHGIVSYLLLYDVNWSLLTVLRIFPLRRWCWVGSLIYHSIHTYQVCSLHYSGNTFLYSYLRKNCVVQWGSWTLPTLSNKGSIWLNNFGMESEVLCTNWTFNTGHYCIINFILYQHPQQLLLMFSGDCLP